MIKTILAVPLSILAVWMVIMAQRCSKITHKIIREDVKRIFDSRVFKAEDKVKSELSGYFNSRFKDIRMSAFYYSLAFIIYLSLFSWTSGPWWLILLITFLLFMMPVSIIIVKILDLKTLKSDIMEKFS